MVSVARRRSQPKRTTVRPVASSTPRIGSLGSGCRSRGSRMRGFVSSSDVFPSTFPWNGESAFRSSASSRHDAGSNQQVIATTTSFERVASTPRSENTQDTPHSGSSRALLNRDGIRHRSSAVAGISDTCIPSSRNPLNPIPGTRSSAPHDETSSIPPGLSGRAGGVSAAPEGRGSPFVMPGDVDGNTHVTTESRKAVASHSRRSCSAARSRFSVRSDSRCSAE